VYLLHSTSNHGLYIGYSTGLKRQLSRNQAGAAIATKHRGPWKLIYYEAYTEQADAEGRERYLKSGSGRRLLRRQLRHYFEKFPSRVPRKHSGFTRGYPAWIRTKNNASKGRCVTVTPRGNCPSDLRFSTAQRKLQLAGRQTSDLGRARVTIRSVSAGEYRRWCRYRRRWKSKFFRHALPPPSGQWRGQDRCRSIFRGS
jgi:putative endonuclease